jgi:fumarate reductase subunit D
MDKADVDIRKGELQYKRRGQSIAAWLTPILIILVGIFVYFTMDADNQTEVLRHFLRFIIWIAALFVTGRVVSGIENIFSKRK